MLGERGRGESGRVARAVSEGEGKGVAEAVLEEIGRKWLELC